MDVEGTDSAREELGIPAHASQTHTSTLQDMAESFPEESDEPTVEHKAWLKDDDYWQRSTYIAVTGRQTVSLKQTRPLPRPDRFRKFSLWRSVTIFGLTIALIVLIPLGVIFAQRTASEHLKLPTSIPGLSPTVTPVRTHTITPTPKK
ncbi:MAG TPA: hypothetical protein VF792_11025 [Ktedonobacterales bacterium]